MGGHYGAALEHSPALDFCAIPNLPFAFRRRDVSFSNGDDVVLAAIRSSDPPRTASRVVVDAPGRNELERFSRFLRRRNDYAYVRELFTRPRPGIAVNIERFNAVFYVAGTVTPTIRSRRSRRTRRRTNDLTRFAPRRSLGTNSFERPKSSAALRDVDNRKNKIK